MIPTDLLDTLATALDEDLAELISGNSRHLPERTKRQAFLFILHRDAGYSIAKLADWLRRAYPMVQGAIKAAQDAYDTNDIFFINRYLDGREAFTKWLQTQPESV